MKRIGLFLFYDKDGIADDYVPYLLRQLRDHLTRSIVIVNGIVTEESLLRLRECSDEVIIRENRGYDFAGWREALCSRIGWDSIETYDELLLMNDSVFGPLTSLTEMFAEMEKRAPDFWGITLHGATGDIPEHLQSWFLVFRQPVLKDPDFRNWWEALPESKSFQDAILNNEVRLTPFLFSLGYTYDAYIRTRDMDGTKGNLPVDHSMFNALAFLRRGAPFCKRKLFSLSAAKYKTQLPYFMRSEDVPLAFRYIRDHTGYDTRMIWQHLLRTANLSDLRDRLHLDYILPTDTSSAESFAPHSALAVFHVVYRDSVERLTPYVCAVPEPVDVLITTISEDVRGKAEKAWRPALGSRLRIIVMENRGRDMAALLVEAKPLLQSYPLFCFCHDKLSNALRTYPYEYYWERSMWENTVSGGDFIRNVLARFAAEPQLGVLTVPPVFYRDLRGLKNWGSDFELTLDFLTEMGIRVPLDPNRDVYTLGTAFWARTAALLPLLELDWTHESFPAEPLPMDGTISHAIERSFGYIAQSQGYYTAIAYTPEYAAERINTYRSVCFDANADPYSPDETARHGVANNLRLLVGAAKIFFENRSHRIIRKIKSAAKSQESRGIRE